MTDRAIVYATFNGVFNNTNGIGRQTKTMLSTLARHHGEWQEEFGRFDFHLVSPLPLPTLWGYSPLDLEHAVTVTGAAGGRVHFCPLPAEPEAFWSCLTWEALSTSCAALVCSMAKQYREILVLAIDTPFLGVGHMLRDARTVVEAELQVLLLPYSTSLIVDRLAPSLTRLDWERAAIDFVNGTSLADIGDIGAYLTRHLIEDFHLDPQRLVPFPSSLDVGHEEYAPMPVEEARQRVAAAGVPLDRPIVLAFGRADPIKGFDVLIRALGPLRDQVHLVLIAVPYTPADATLRQYERLITETGIRATCVWRYDRDLPRSLCQIPETSIVACPSLGETLSNVPFEVSLWARQAGPVLVCPAADGFVEQVIDGTSGFTYPREGGPDALLTAIRRALAAEDSLRDEIRSAASRDVLAKRDAATNVAAMLRHYWSDRGRVSSRT